MSKRREQRSGVVRRQMTRRRFVALVGASSAASLAGCSSGSNGTPSAAGTTPDSTARTSTENEGPAAAEALVLPAAAARELELAETTRTAFTYALPPDEGGD